MILPLKAPVFLFPMMHLYSNNNYSKILILLLDYCGPHLLPQFLWLLDFCTELCLGPEELTCGHFGTTIHTFVQMLGTKYLFLFSSLQL